MAIHTHKDGPRVYRYFTGKGVGFLHPHSIIRLRLHERFERAWAIHTRDGWDTLLERIDDGKIQLLDLLYERDELEEFVAGRASLDESNPGLEIPSMEGTAHVPET